MIVKYLKTYLLFRNKKKTYYDQARRGNTDLLKQLFSSDEFYLYRKKNVFQMIHICAHSADASFRNEIVDFLLTNEKYLRYMKKNVKKFPYSNEEIEAIVKSNPDSNTN